MFVCKSQSECSQLGYGGARERYFWVDKSDYSPLEVWNPKSEQNLKLFGLSKGDNVFQYLVRKSLNKEGKKPGTKESTLLCLVTPRVLQYKPWSITPK